MATTTSSMPRTRKRKDGFAKNGEKRFACHHDGCGRSFTRAEHLQRHLLNHSTGEFTCSRCRAHFKRRDLLGEPLIPDPLPQPSLELLRDLSKNPQQVLVLLFW